MNDSESKINDYQIILSVIAIITVIVSIIIIYNQKLKEENKEPFLSDKESYNLSVINRIIILIVFGLLLFINYYVYEKTKQKDEEDLSPFIYQIYASIFTVIAALISLYAVIISKPDEEAEIENPDI